MKTSEIKEGLSYPIIVVDVQPEYSGMNDGDESPIFLEIINFVNKQIGPVLMYVNAEETGVTADSIEDVMVYWDDTIYPEEINWNRFTIVDKGYGYLRSWMDQGVEPSIIIKVIRELYKNKVNDSRMLFGGEDSDTYLEGMKSLIGNEFEDWMLIEPLITNWVNISQLKKFNGAYIVGGGRNECLREVELLMNAFNIKYKRIDSLVY